MKLVRWYLDSVGYPVGDDTVGDKLALVAFTTLILLVGAFALFLSAIVLIALLVWTKGLILLIPGLALIVWVILEAAMKGDE